MQVLQVKMRKQMLKLPWKIYLKDFASVLNLDKEKEKKKKNNHPGFYGNT